MNTLRTLRTLRTSRILPRNPALSTTACAHLPSDDPGGKPNTGHHRTVYDDFFNILESPPTPQTTLSIASTSPTSLTLQDGLVLSHPIILLNNNVFLWDHPKLNHPPQIQW